MSSVTITELALYGAHRSFEIEVKGDSVFMTRAQDYGPEICLEFDRAEFMSAVHGLVPEAVLVG